MVRDVSTNRDVTPYSALTFDQQLIDGQVPGTA